MKPPATILRVGLTGGVASGKTTVGNLLTELGAFVLDADDLAHAAIAPDGPAYDAVVQRFGREMLDEAGRIVRSKLARMVFHDAAARRELNAIVHPIVRAEMERQFAVRAELGTRVAVFDAALLVETGDHRGFDRLIVVRAEHETQIRRLVRRDGLPVAEAEARIAAQAPLEEKLAHADYVIDTDRTLGATRRQTEQVYLKLLQDFEDKVAAVKR